MTTVTRLDRTHLEGAAALDDLQVLTREGLKGDLSRDDRLCLVATDDDRVVGVVVVRLEPGVGHVLDVAVARDRRRRGIGRDLLQATHAAVLATGRDHVTLEYRVGNAAARACYRALGYVEVGVRPDEYLDADGHEDAYVAWWPTVPDDVPVEVTA